MSFVETRQREGVLSDLDFGTAMKQVDINDRWFKLEVNRAASINPVGEIYSGTPEPQESPLLHAEPAVSTEPVVGPSNIGSWDQPIFASFAFKPFAVFRVSDRDHGLRTIRDGLPLEVRDAMLGHDVHHVRARSGYDVSRRQVENDPAPASAPLFVCRGKADE